MYFSSKGHNGIGDFDVFRSTREGDQWTRPVNLGFPVNSVRDDRFFSISPDGKRGYFSSERFETHGGSDIYMVEMEQVDDKFVVVKGSVRDTATNVNLTAEITLVDIQNKSIQGVYRPNKLTGKFIILVKRNVMYSVEVRVAGYVSVVKPLSIPFSNKGDVELNIQMIHE
jgi:hypothetical protein